MTEIGWIGTGVMGGPMAGHLLDAGHNLHVFNRTRERAEGLLAQGANWCDSPAAVGAAAEVVCLMLGYPTDVRETVLGDGSLLESMRPGSLLIDFTTSEPTLAVEIAAVAAERDVAVLDAPVSGGDVGARNAALVIMVGGAEEAFERARPLFEVLGRVATLQGGPGSGQHTKMMNQIAIASGMIGLCEALLYAHRAGLDVEQALDTIKDGAAGSWSLSNYGPRLLRGDLEPGFKIEHFLKDLGIALSEARRMNLSLPGTALAEQLYVAAESHGLGTKGTQALAIALSELSADRWPAAPDPE
ncbi:MAG TPA: NAD(P)-dependent oxidoreductase [Solirubrobacteraceae bacterium]|nr:NAD(P)-dependent oxidoreductase [Solirubrobacteraceae bacterium]